MKKRSKFSASRPHCGEDERREMWDGKMMVRREQTNEELMTNGSFKCGKITERIIKKCNNSNSTYIVIE